MNDKPSVHIPSFRKSFHSPESRLKWLLMILVVTIAGSTIGYRLIGGGSLLDALYMTVITIATVGFKEVYPVTNAEKIFTMVVITFSVVILAYTIGTLGQFLVEGELREILGRRKMEKKIKQLNDHFIIVGYGRVGQMVYQEFKRHEVDAVVIENDPQMIAELSDDAPLLVAGSATEDEVLLQAGIQNARGLVSTTPSEADSVFITLTARQLNPRLFIIARADSKAMEKKLSRAGADKVVLPYEIGGKRMAMASLRPNVVDYMTIESISGQLGLSIEEVEIFPDAQVVGRTLKDSELRSKYGVTVIGIKKPNGDLDLNPSSELVVEKGDILILIGKTEALESLQGISKG